MVFKLKPERDDGEAARGRRRGLCPRFGTKEDVGSCFLRFGRRS